MNIWQLSPVTQYMHTEAMTDWQRIPLGVCNACCKGIPTTNYWVLIFTLTTGMSMLGQLQLGYYH